MSTPRLKTPTEITALIDAETYADLPADLKHRLTTQVLGASEELSMTLPVLLANAGGELERRFLYDLLEVPVSTPVAAPEAPMPTNDETVDAKG